MSREGGYSTGWSDIIKGEIGALHHGGKEDDLGSLRSTSGLPHPQHKLVEVGSHSSDRTGGGSDLRNEGLEHFSR